MHNERAKRVLEKADLIRKRAGEIDAWKSGFFSEERDKLAIYKAMQEIAEACMDVIAMMLKAGDMVPEDDYSNIIKIIKSGLIPDGLKDSLDDLNGLRNRIVHEYNGLDDKIAYDAMNDILPAVLEFVKVVEKWTGK